MFFFVREILLGDRAGKNLQYVRRNKKKVSHRLSTKTKQKTANQKASTVVVLAVDAALTSPATSFAPWTYIAFCSGVLAGALVIPTVLMLGGR